MVHQTTVLTGPIVSTHCRSRLILLNKAKDPIPNVGDLRPITIIGTMQKLLETSIVHHLKKAMEKTSPFQFGFKPGTGTGEAMLRTGTGEAILRLNIKMKELSEGNHLVSCLLTSKKLLIIQ